MGIYQVAGKAKTSPIVKVIAPKPVDETGQYRNDCELVKKQPRLSKQDLKAALEPNPDPEAVHWAYNELDLSMKNILMATDIKDKIPCPVLTDEYPKEYSDTQYCEPKDKKLQKKIKEKVQMKGWTGGILYGGFDLLNIPGEYVCSCPIKDKKNWYKFDSFDDARNYTRERCINGKKDDIASLELRRKYPGKDNRGVYQEAPLPHSIQLAWKQFDSARHASTRDKVLAIDKLIHSAHDRGGMADKLVEGGFRTLEDLAGRSYADTLRKLLN